MRHQWNPIAYSTTFRGEAHYVYDSVYENEKHNHCAHVLRDVYRWPVLGSRFTRTKRSKKKRKKQVQTCSARPCEWTTMAIFFSFSFFFFSRNESFPTLWMGWVLLKFRVRIASEEFNDHHFRWQTYRNFMLASTKMRQVFGILLFHRSLPEAEIPICLHALENAMRCAMWSIRCRRRHRHHRRRHRHHRRLFSFKFEKGKIFHCA